VRKSDRLKRKGGGILKKKKSNMSYKHRDDPEHKRGKGPHRRQERQDLNSIQERTPNRQFVCAKAKLVARKRILPIRSIKQEGEGDDAEGNCTTKLKVSTYHFEMGEHTVIGKRRSILKDGAKGKTRCEENTRPTYKKNGE